MPVRLGLVRGGRQQHALLLAEARAELSVKPQHHGMDRTCLHCTAGLRARSGIFEAGHPSAQLAVNTLPILQAKLAAMRHLHVAWKLSSKGPPCSFTCRVKSAVKSASCGVMLVRSKLRSWQGSVTMSFAWTGATWAVFRPSSSSCFCTGLQSLTHV